MKMTKKAFSIVLALVMLVNVFAVMASALAPDSACDLYISADKTTYAPGEEIVLTISEQVEAEVGKMQIAGTYVIGYNSLAISPYSDDVSNLEAHGFSPIQDGYDSSISSLTPTAGIDATYGWDAAIAYNVCSDGFTDFVATSKTDLFTVKMKIKADAPDGDYVIGFNTVSYSDDECIGYAVDSANGGIYGSTPLYSTTNNYSFGTVTIHVGSAAPASILNPFKSQIRFDKNTDGTYAGTFDVRQLAVVSKADFESTFGATTAEQIAAIAEVGFVFARTSTVATFDVEAAKALVESGTAATGYTKKTVDYITTNAVVGTGNYGFSCIVEDIPTADNTDGMNALAYIKGTDGTYHYYPAAQSTSFNDLYTTHYTDAFPG